MQLDITTRAVLTKEFKDGDSIKAVPCDLDGNALGAGQFPISILTDSTTGKRYGRVAALLPSETDPSSVSAKAAILARNPVFFSHDDGAFRGYYVPVADYSYHEAPVA